MIGRNRGAVVEGTHRGGDEPIIGLEPVRSGKDELSLIDEGTAPSREPRVETETERGGTGPRVEGTGTHAQLRLGEFEIHPQAELERIPLRGRKRILETDCGLGPLEHGPFDVGDQAVQCGIALGLGDRQLMTDAGEVETAPIDPVRPGCEHGSVEGIHRHHHRAIADAEAKQARADGGDDRSRLAAGEFDGGGHGSPEARRREERLQIFYAVRARPSRQVLAL